MKRKKKGGCFELIPTSPSRDFVMVMPVAPSKPKRSLWRGCWRLVSGFVRWKVRVIRHVVKKCEFFKPRTSQQLHIIFVRLMIVLWIVECCLTLPGFFLQ
jgi:hypothetical protein